MNLTACDEKTIKIINNYSNSGNLILDTDPNQLDYSLRFRALQDTAQKMIATVKKIQRYFTVEEADITITDASFIEIDMPTVYYQMEKVEYDEKPVQWRARGRNKITVNKLTTFPIDVFYFAYPQDITDSTLGTYEFEIDTEAQEAIPYYVAAHMLMDESNLYATLLGIYNNMLANLDTKIANSPNGVQNSLFSATAKKLF
jgi:hypothetical protein